MKKQALYLAAALTLCCQSPLISHCQMPCGIYHDDMVFDQIDQYVETMVKAMAVFRDNKFDTTQARNEFTRWVLEKENGSDDAAELILKRRDLPIWVLPGGGIDAGETAEDAVVREVLEETGLHVQVVRKTAEYTPLNRLAALTTLFECQVIGGKLTIGPETKAVGFYPLGSFPRPFFHIHQDWLNDALSNPTAMIQKPIHQVTYWNVVKYFFKHPIILIRTCLARCHD